MKKILSIGEATLDAIVFLSEANVHCTLHKEKCEFCINYADKVMADNLKFSLGGNAANTAVAFSRLGLDSQLFSVIGDDWIGKHAHELLEKEKVDCRYVETEPGPTSYATALIFQGERNLIIYHVPREYVLPDFEPVDWIYLTSMGQAYIDAYRKVLAFTKQHQAKISFNPGTFQLRAGVKVLKPYLEITEALFVNKEEARQLTELPASASIHDLSVALYDLGPKIINITDGPVGAYSFDGQQLLFLDIFPVPVVQRTGCGDSYASGFTAALLHGKTIDEAMRWGMANAAGVVSHTGPQEGLLTKDTLFELLSDFHKIQPKPVRK